MIAMFRPLKVRGFLRLGSAYAINDIGDMVGAVALAILVFDRTHSALATTALFVAAKFLPALIAPMVVAHVEPLPTGRTLALIHFLEMVFYIVLVALVHRFSLPIILLIAFVDGTLALTARALLRGGLAVLLEPKGVLREGNALFNLVFALSTAAGPAFAGLLIAWKGVEAALLVDAASFAIVAAMFVRAKLAPPKVDESLWRDRIRRGIAFVRDNYDIRTLLGAEGMALVFFASVVPIEVVYAKKTLGAGDAGYGLLLSAWGVGIIVGSIIFVFVRRIPLLPLIGLATLAIGGAYAGQAISPTIAVACGFAVLGGLGNGVQSVAVLTAIQTRTPDVLQARVAGLFEALGAGMPGIGFVLGGAITTLFTPRIAFAVAAGGVVAVVLMAGLIFVRHYQRERRNQARAAEISGEPQHSESSN